MTNEEKTKIINLRKEGNGYKKIAKEVPGVSISSIRFICNELEKTLLCLNCGNKLEMIPHHKEKKYCNDRCRYEYWNKKRGSKND